MIYAILHKPSNLIATVVYGELAKTEGDSFKAFPITEAVADRIHNVLNRNLPQSKKIIEAVLGKKRVERRNQQSEQYKQDKQNAIKMVMKGTKPQLAASRYNVNVTTLRGWVWRENNSI